MNDVEKVRRALKVINEKGDLYDVIAVREDVKSYNKSFFRNHLLLFSRILYLGLRVVDKVNAHFSPIKEVKKAQDTIRSIVGVPVDIVKNKFEFDFFDVFNSDDFEKTIETIEEELSIEISILYENPNITVEEYIEHLKRILSFCELYGIPRVYLSENDIVNLFPDIDLESYRYCRFKDILNCSFLQKGNSKNAKEDEKYNGIYQVSQTLYSEFLKLSQSELRRLIKQLEIKKISKQTVLKLGNKIEDLPVRNAIMDFLKRGNLQKLREIVTSRLTLTINSDSSSKNREYGKVSQNVTIKGEYINVITTNKEGQVISNIVTTLYDYLGVIDYSMVLKQLDLKDDNKEVLAMTALHLYLEQCIKVKMNSSKETLSFYDYIYETCFAKQKRKVKKIPGLYSKGEKRYRSIMKFFSNTIISFLLVLLICGAGVSGAFLAELCFHNDYMSALENVVDIVVSPYIKSFEFERSIVEKFFQDVRVFKKEFVDFTKAYSGDVNESVVTNDTIMGRVSVSSDIDFPIYYANGYAIDGCYHDGYIQYQTELPIIDMDDFRDIESVLEVSMMVSPDIINFFITDDSIKIPQFLYPIGIQNQAMNFVLTRVQIVDNNSSKSFEMDVYRFLLEDNQITDAEKELLCSMESPVLIYSYGLGDCNAFVEKMHKEDSYTDVSPSEIRTAIIKGLKLKEDASNEEIFEAIKNKGYSTTPLKDAGLSKKITRMDVQKYFQTVASLNSLVCNLATSLACGVDEKLIYTVGYAEDGDGCIRSNEAHAWAMTMEGEIIDITPFAISEEESSFLFNVFEWGIENKIPFYVLTLLIVKLFDSVFGKKIRLELRVRKVANLLSSPNTEEALVSLENALYDTDNISVSRTPLQLAETIERELGCFTIEELKSIRSKLLKGEIQMDENLKEALDLLKATPILKENSFRIKQKLKTME